MAREKDDIERGFDGMLLTLAFGGYFIAAMCAGAWLITPPPPVINVLVAFCGVGWFGVGVYATYAFFKGSDL